MGIGNYFRIDSTKDKKGTAFKKNALPRNCDVNQGLAIDASLCHRWRMEIRNKHKGKS